MFFSSSCFEVRTRQACNTNIRESGFEAVGGEQIRMVSTADGKFNKNQVLMVSIEENKQFCGY